MMKKLFFAILICSLFVACQKEEDKNAPVIIMNGGTVDFSLGEDYVEPGVIAEDEVDRVIYNVTSTNNIDITKVGTYTITYSAKDIAGNIGTATRNVRYTAGALSNYYRQYYPISYNKLYFSSGLYCYINTFEFHFEDVAVTIEGNSFTIDQEYSIENGRRTYILHPQTGEIFYEQDYTGTWNITKMDYVVTEYYDDEITSTDTYTYPSN